MNIKTVLTAVLLLFVLASLLVLGYQALRGTEPSDAVLQEGTAVPVGTAGAKGVDEATGAAGETDRASSEMGEAEIRIDGGDRVVAYYFYGFMRCPTCNRIEELTRETIDAGFADAMKGGRLEWKPVNMDQPPNKHFKTDFDLHSPSLVLVEVKDGRAARWKVCQQVWELVRVPDKFRNYVDGEIRAYLGEG